ncbi:MAG: homoserine kinase [Trueperaceae bacterium]|jgi:homoserine kinase|nr:homoserine kinase [Trueperaceae bacterium]|tara:strand:- start:7095 stop:7973 length:879 start_codon:yes stop_codon:yes gene_type:complete
MIQVRVPATSANLGPGFDCLGIALDLELSVVMTPSAYDHFRYTGEGMIPETSDNLIHVGFREAFRRSGNSFPRATFTVDNPIPLARGLGSSSAALIAGAAVADHMLGNPLGREGVFQLTAELEGHPDNVAPATFGGFTVSTRNSENGYLSRSLSIPANWRLLFGVPAFELATTKAREILPDKYNRNTTVLTAGRVALWTLAVAEEDPSLLRTASQDDLHEPYRESLIPGFMQTKQKLYDHGAYAAFLSGGGPSIGAICDDSTAPECKSILNDFVGSTGQVFDLTAGTGYRIT